MGQNTFDIGASLKRALPSLVMFAIGFFIVYKFFDEHNIYYCSMLGWIFGGSIWGWFLTGKWFHRSDSSNFSGSHEARSMKATLASMLRVFVSVLVGIIAMPIGIIQLIIAIILLFFKRGNAKKAGDYAKTENTENQ